MKTAILGGGFGLYGYLPALAACDAQIVLPEKYRETVAGRPDIAVLEAQIDWRSEASISEDCAALVVALPPSEQMLWIEKAVRSPNITHLFLEKPLAVDPAAGDKALRLLTASGKKFRIGYNFRFTPWGKDILRDKRGVEAMDWQFRAHHYLRDLSNWKRDHRAGGGALRFYGIHLIALLAECGYDRAVSSNIVAGGEGEAAVWRAEIAGPGLPLCRVSVDSNATETKFIVSGQGGKTTLLKQPFEVPEARSGDERVPLLVEGLKDLFAESEISLPWYGRANELWAEIEEQTMVTS